MALAQVLHESLCSFKDSLSKFMIGVFKAQFGENWVENALHPPNSDAIMTHRVTPETWDIVMLISLMHTHWDALFGPLANRLPRSSITLVRNMRNLWAHQQEIGPREMYRTLDTMVWVLESFGINAQELDKTRMKVAKELYRECAAKLKEITQREKLGKQKAGEFTGDLPRCPGCQKIILRTHSYECPYGRCVMCIFCLVEFLQTGHGSCPVCGQLFQDIELLRIKGLGIQVGIR